MRAYAAIRLREMLGFRDEKIECFLKVFTGPSAGHSGLAAKKAHFDSHRRRGLGAHPVKPANALPQRWVGFFSF